MKYIIIKHLNEVSTAVLSLCFLWITGHNRHSAGPQSEAADTEKVVQSKMCLGDNMLCKL